MTRDIASRPSAIVEEPMPVAWLHSNGAVVTPKDLADLKSRFDPEFGDITRDFKPLYTSPQPHTGRAAITEAMTDAFMEELNRQGVAMDDFSPPIYPARLIRAALNAALTVEPEAPWQPIETAPKDGTHILAMLAREACVDIDGKRWPAFCELREIWFKPHVELGMSLPWHAGDPFDTHDGMPDCHMGEDVPSYWQPLPARVAP